MSRDDDLAPPTTGSADHVHTTVGVILGAIPYVGGAATALFSTVITPPLEKRLHAWRESVAESVHEARLDFDKLRQNDDFIDCVLHASQIALRTSQQEKLDALRNAIVNAAAPGAPAQAVQQTFLSFVDSFTEWHLRILKLFHDPRR